MFGGRSGGNDGFPSRMLPEVNRRHSSGVHRKSGGDNWGPGRALTRPGGLIRDAATIEGHLRLPQIAAAAISTMNKVSFLS